jgi:hypothetical protein
MGRRRRERHFREWCSGRGAFLTSQEAADVLDFALSFLETNAPSFGGEPEALAIARQLAEKLISTLPRDQTAQQ